MSSPLHSPVVGGSAPQRNRLPRLAGAAVERARLSVVPRTRGRATRVPFVTLVTLLLVGGVVGLLLFNTSMQQASFASSALEAQATALSAREQSLRTDLEDLRDPQRLGEQATRMGMVLPAAPCFLHEGTGRIEGVCTPAVPDGALPVALPRPTKPAALTPAPIVVQAEPTAQGRKPGAKPGKARRDTTSGSRGNGGRQGRQGSQQSQQPQESQQSQQSAARPTTRR